VNSVLIVDKIGDFWSPPPNKKLKPAYAPDPAWELIAISRPLKSVVNPLGQALALWTTLLERESRHTTLTFDYNNQKFPAVRNQADDNFVFQEESTLAHMG